MIRTAVHFTCYAMVWMMVLVIALGIVGDIAYVLGQASARMLGLTFEDGVALAVAYVVAGAGIILAHWHR